MTAFDQSQFGDSEFEWDGAGTRTSQHDLRNPTEMERLAWVVLVLLTFCPAAGFVLASLF